MALASVTVAECNDGDEKGACREVVLLGAGFSKAVSDRFPLTIELGPLAFDVAGVPDRERPPEGTGFESWLSRIAEDQPYRSVEGNLGARQLFARMSGAIARVLVERQRAALLDDAPAWTDHMVSVLHARRSTVVTFNYDNVVECAVDGHCLTDSSDGIPRHVTSHDILDRLPPLPATLLSEELPVDWSPIYETVGRPPIMLPEARQVAETFRLLKLHGSLSWYWATDDTTGVTVQRWRSPGVFGEPFVDDEEEGDTLCPGAFPS